MQHVTSFIYYIYIYLTLPGSIKLALMIALMIFYITSYSVVSNTSGISHNSAAFVGCDKGVVSHTEIFYSVKVS